MENNTNNRSNNINFKEDYSMEIRFANAQQTNCSDMMLPGGGFYGGEQTDVLPGGGFHGGEQTDVLPGGGFHTSDEQPTSEHLDDNDLHEDEVNDEKLPCQGTFGVDWFFV